MRPTKEATDLEFWTASQTHWATRLEFWFLETAHATGAWLAECERQMDRCRARVFAAELAHQEARGEIVVYTGRAKPGWA